MLDALDGVAKLDDVDICAHRLVVAVGGAVPTLVDVAAVEDHATATVVEVNLEGEDAGIIAGYNLEEAYIVAGVVGREGVGNPDTEGVVGSFARVWCAFGGL